MNEERGIRLSTGNAITLVMAVFAAGMALPGLTDKTDDKVNVLTTQLASVEAKVNFLVIQEGKRSEREMMR
jgi:hypothetical protein